MITQPVLTLADATMRGVHRSFVTGVTVVTTTDQDTPKGLAVNAFTSISLDPPLVMVCVQQSSATHDPLLHSTHLGIDILAADQRSTAAVFASKAADKFATIGWERAEHGTPVLTGTCAWMEAEICQRLDFGTHTAFIARVVNADHSDRPALVYRAGEFFDGSDLSCAQHPSITSEQ
ncbi:MAG TPA: flavin reductase family protein [Aldersonia sp.]